MLYSRNDFKGDYPGGSNLITQGLQNQSFPLAGGRRGSQRFKTAKRIRSTTAGLKLEFTGKGKESDLSRS